MWESDTWIFPDVVEGTLTDNEFDYQGTTHKVVLLYQHNGGNSDGNVFLGLVPPLSEEDIRSFTFTADGGALDLQTIQTEEAHTAMSIPVLGGLRASAST